MPANALKQADSPSDREFRWVLKGREDRARAEARDIFYGLGAGDKSPAYLTKKADKFPAQTACLRRPAAACGCVADCAVDQGAVQGIETREQRGNLGDKRVCQD